MHRWIFAINVAIFFVLAASLVFFFTQKQGFLNSITQANKQSPAASPSPTGVQKAATPTAQVITSKDTQSAIIKYTNSTDRQFLEPFMAKNVSVILYATDCCQPMSPKDAIKQIDYINKGMPFTFDQKKEEIVSLKAKNPQFSNTFIGISQTGEQAIIYAIGAGTNLIESVQMSVSWKLY